MDLVALKYITTGDGTVEPGDPLTVSKKEGKRLIDLGAAEVPVKADSSDVDINALTLESVADLDYGQLKYVAKELELNTPDIKADTLRAAIVALFAEPTPDLDAMDMDALMALAAGNDIEIPEGADEDAVRSLVGDQLNGEGGE